MLIKKVHHVAYRCIDAKQTVEWYEKYLGMKFILAIAEDEVPSTKEPDPYMHVFLDAGQGNVLAFFELPTRAPMDRDRNTPVPGCSTWRSRSTRSTRCWPPRHGCKRTVSKWSARPTTRSSSRSTSSTQTGIAWSWPPTPPRAEMLQKLDEVKYAMLEEWARTKRAPKHAAVDARRQLFAGVGALMPLGRVPSRGRIMTTLNATHDPTLRSWVASANHLGCDFPIQNLPFGRFRRRGQRAELAHRHRDRRPSARPAGRGPDRHRRHERADGRCAVGAPRAARQRSRQACAKAARSKRRGPTRCCRRRRPSTPCPAASATTPTSTPASTMPPRSASCSGPTSRCMPNYKWVPIGYHGRASSIVVSGQAFKRPQGQTKTPDAAAPGFGPSQAPGLRA